MLRGGAMARAKIERIIGVHTVSDSGKTARLRQLIQRREQFVLAEIAAVGSVGAVSGIIHFVRLDKLVGQAQLADKFFYYGEIVSGVTRRESGDRKSATGERFVGSPGQISRIRATRERDNDGRNFSEASEQKIFSFFRGHSVALCFSNMNELFHLSQSISQSAAGIADCATAEVT